MFLKQDAPIGILSLPTTYNDIIFKSMYFHKSKGTCKQTSKHKELHVKARKNNHCEFLKIEL
jgi:hypothetical protein